MGYMGIRDPIKKYRKSYSIYLKSIISDISHPALHGFTDTLVEHPETELLELVATRLPSLC